MNLTGFHSFLAFILLQVSCCVVGSTAFSQELPTQATTVYDQDGVVITASWQDCIDEQNGTAKQYVLLTASNSNSNPVQLSFKKENLFNGVCNSCGSDSPEHRISVTLDANSSLAGSCNGSNDLRIFSKMLNLKNVRQLTHYELTDIVVDEIR